MTLREYLESTEDDFFYVGVQNGYLTIGDKETVIYDLNFLSKDYLQKYKSSIKQNKVMYERFSRLIPVHIEELEKLENSLAKCMERKKLPLTEKQENILKENIELYETRIANKKITIEYQTKELPRIKNYIKNQKKYLSVFKEFIDREVLDVKKTSFLNPKGVIVLIEGQDYGMYWDYEEYLRKEGNVYGK